MGVVVSAAISWPAGPARDIVDGCDDADVSG